MKAIHIYIDKPFGNENNFEMRLYSYPQNNIMFNKEELKFAAYMLEHCRNNILNRISIMEEKENVKNIIQNMIEESSVTN